MTQQSAAVFHALGSRLSSRQARSYRELCRTTPQAKESWELDTKEKLATAAARKDAGNEKFKAGKTALAIAKYKVRREKD